MRREVIRIGRGRSVPAGILDEGVVRAQVHGHAAAVRRGRNELRRNPHGDGRGTVRTAVRRSEAACRRAEHAAGVPHEPLGFHGAHDPGFIVPGLPHRRVRALKQAVIALRVEQTVLREARSPELVIDVRRDHEMIPVLHEPEQFPIDRLRRIDVTVNVNIPGPERPAGLIIRKRVKSARIHVPEAEGSGKVREVRLEPLPRVGKPGRRREACARTDHDRVGLRQTFPQNGDPLGERPAPACHPSRHLPRPGNAQGDRASIAVAIRGAEAVSPVLMRLADSLKRPAPGGVAILFVRIRAAHRSSCLRP